MSNAYVFSSKSTIYDMFGIFLSSQEFMWPHINDNVYASLNHIAFVPERFPAPAFDGIAFDCIANTFWDG